MTVDQVLDAAGERLVEVALDCLGSSSRTLEQSGLEAIPVRAWLYRDLVSAGIEHHYFVYRLEGVQIVLKVLGVNRDRPEQLDGKMLVPAGVELGEDSLIPLHLDGRHIVGGDGVKAHCPEDALSEGLRILFAKLYFRPLIASAGDLEATVYAEARLWPHVRTHH